jgi:hypothetical protein
LGASRSGLRVFQHNSPASVSLSVDDIKLKTNTPEPSLTGVVGAVLIAFGILLSGK